MVVGRAPDAGAGDAHGAEARPADRDITQADRPFGRRGDHASWPVRARPFSLRLGLKRTATHGGSVDPIALNVVANVATAVAVTVGLGAALVQLRHNERRRREEAAMSLLQSRINPEAIRALDIVYALPDGISPAALEARGRETVEAANVVYTMCENLGYTVFHRIVGLEEADEMVGGLVRTSWRKLAPWVEAKRAATGSPHPGEWFQWLHERLVGRPGPAATEGAHVAYRSWRP